MRYVALLRGVNVGTAKRVPMAGLRALVGELGGADVRTLRGSGNVVFTHARTSSRSLAVRIREALASHLHVDAPVIVLGAAELDAIVAGNPLAGSADDPSRLLAAIPARPSTSRSSLH